MVLNNLWDGKRVRLVTFAWGRVYVDRLLMQALSAALAPGNLPSLTKRFDCEVVVVTEESQFDYVRDHPIGLRIQSICSLKLIAIDDLIAEPWQYGITLAYALFRGFSDLADAMTDTFILFLNADFILADGCYERLIPYMLAGHRAVLSPSYCVVEDNVSPHLANIANDNGGIISIPPREMAAVILANQHNTIRAKTVNQTSFHFKYADQFYWLIDDNTLLGHQMPIALVGLRPEVVLNDIGTFWDWGVVYELCPSRNLTVIGDSDEFLMLELREESTHREFLLPGPGESRTKSLAMSGYITQYQLDSSRFDLTLHSHEIPFDTDKARRELRCKMQEVLDHVFAQSGNFNNSQWRYHQDHLKYFQKTKDQRTALARLRTRLAEIESVTCFSEYGALKAKSKHLERKQLRGRNFVVGLYSKNIIMRLASKAIISLFDMYSSVFQAIPAGPCHATWMLYRDFLLALKGLGIQKQSRTLILCNTTDSYSAKSVKTLPCKTNAIAFAQLNETNVFSNVLDDDKYDNCVICLEYADQSYLELAIQHAKLFLRPDGTAIFHVLNVSPHHSHWVDNVIARILMCNPVQTSFRIGGNSLLSRKVLDLGFKLVQRGGRNPLRLAISLGGLLLLVPVAYFANFKDSRRAELIPPFKSPYFGRSLTGRIVF